MSDINCIKCGEPWDSYSLQPGIYNDPEGHGDFTKEEAERFRKGEGCMSCRFGTVCTNCDGAGRYRANYGASCKCCEDRGFVLGRVFRGEATIGWQPTVRRIGYLGDLPKKTIGVRSFPEFIRRFVCLEGAASDYWFLCPDCKGEGEHRECIDCGGTGKPREEKTDSEWSSRVESHLEATDEDPILTLERLGEI